MVTPSSSPTPAGSGGSPAPAGSAGTTDLTPALTPDLTRADRMGRLPWTRKHTRLLFGAGGGWALDAMDVGLIGFVVAALAKEWALSPTDKSWIATVGFIGMAIGATVGGLLADRYGRRNVFALTLLLYGIATGASALAGSLAVLLAFRFFVGLGLGAELPVASTLVSEISPTKIRGRVVVLLESFWAVGWIAAAAVAKFVIPEFEDGWRWALALGAIPAVYSVVIRWGMPESPVYLERRGQHDAAEAIVADFERAAEVPTPSRTQPLPPKEPTPPGALWSSRFARRTLGIWLVWFFVNLSYYGAFFWMPTLLDQELNSLTKAFTFTLIITLAQLPGYFVAAWLIEVWGRRATLAVFLVGSAVSAGFFGFANTSEQLIAAGCALSFFNLGAWGALYAITPEIYPTMLRGAGTGSAAGFGRIASILSPWVVPLLAERGGNPVTFAVFSASFVIAAAAALFLLPEPKGTSLEV